MTLTLVTGGARSGKSRFAEGLAREGRPPVLYVATAEVLDDEMAVRVGEHRARRPSEWGTLEARTDIGAALARLPDLPGTVLLDDLGLLVTNLLLDLCGPDDPTAETARELDAVLTSEVGALLAAQTTPPNGGWDLIVVTNEVGLGIVPATPLGRVFRDALGRANQAVAARSDEVYLLVAGLPLRIKPGCEHQRPGGRRSVRFGHATGPIRRLKGALRRACGARWGTFAQETISG